MAHKHGRPSPAVEGSPLACLSLSSPFGVSGDSLPGPPSGVLVPFPGPAYTERTPWETESTGRLNPGSAMSPLGVNTPELPYLPRLPQWQTGVVLSMPWRQDCAPGQPRLKLDLLSLASRSWCASLLRRFLKIPRWEKRESKEVFHCFDVTRNRRSQVGSGPKRGSVTQVH